MVAVSPGWATASFWSPPLSDRLRRGQWGRPAPPRIPPAPCQRSTGRDEANKSGMLSSSVPFLNQFTSILHTTSYQYSNSYLHVLTIFICLPSKRRQVSVLKLYQYKPIGCVLVLFATSAYTTARNSKYEEVRETSGSDCSCLSASLNAL